MTGVDIMTWVLTLVGVLGFHLAAKQIWWAWYINIANQAVWAAYAVVTEQWAFLIGVAFYTAVFSNNARNWTRKHINESLPPIRVPEHAPFSTVKYLTDYETYALKSHKHFYRLNRIDDEIMTFECRSSICRDPWFTMARIELWPYQYERVNHE